MRPSYHWKGNEFVRIEAAARADIKETELTCKSQTPHVLTLNIPSLNLQYPMSETQTPHVSTLKTPCLNPQHRMSLPSTPTSQPRRLHVLTLNTACLNPQHPCLNPQHSMSQPPTPHVSTLNTHVSTLDTPCLNPPAKATSRRSVWERSFYVLARSRSKFCLDQQCQRQR